MGQPDRDARDPEAPPARVPRLPRGRSMRWMWTDLFRIAFLVVMLVALVTLRDTCSTSVAGFVNSFSPPDAGPPQIPEGYELLTPQRARELFPDESEVRDDTVSGSDGAGADAGASEPAVAAPREPR